MPRCCRVRVVTAGIAEHGSGVDGLDGGGCHGGVGERLGDCLPGQMRRRGVGLAPEPAGADAPDRHGRIHERPAPLMAGSRPLSGHPNQRIATLVAPGEPHPGARQQRRGVVGRGDVHQGLAAPRRSPRRPARPAASGRPRERAAPWNSRRCRQARKSQPRRAHRHRPDRSGGAGAWGSRRRRSAPRAALREWRRGEDRDPSPGRRPPFVPAAPSTSEDCTNAAAPSTARLIAFARAGHRSQATATRTGPGGLRP